jgi:archaellum component FlaF (FlaF/FlaG flagellin family)
MNKLNVSFIVFVIMFWSVSSFILNAQDSTKKADTKIETTETKTVTIPAGTEMMVHFDTAINTEEYPGGSLFQESLNIDLVVDGKLVAKKGTAVFGRVIESRGGRLFGGEKLTFTFTGIMIGDQEIAIVTDTMGVQGGQGGTAKTVGAGALIGAAFGGAGEGAAIAGGIAILKSRHEHIQIPQGTIAQFKIEKSVEIKE